MRRAAIAALIGAALLLGATADAHAVRVFGGVVPDIASHTPVRPPDSVHAANLAYDGGSVLHSNRTHLIFWEPSGSGLSFEPGYESLIERFLADVAADSHQPTNVYALSGQYRDAGGPAVYDSSYAGAVLTTDPLPANGCNEPLGPPLGPGPGWQRCLSAEQLQAELVRVIVVDNLPQTAQEIYFMITPNGLGSCQSSGPETCALGGSTPGSYCGYHSVTPQGVPYAVIPYNAVAGHCQSGDARPNSSTADPAISTLSHEHNETVTDPYGNAWIDTAFHEDGDLCQSSFGPNLGGAGAGVYNEMIDGHHYFLQEEWSNTDSSCQPRDEADAVSFVLPRRLRAHRPATFTGSASDPDGQIITYSWSFGDRRSATGQRTSHTFSRPGPYTVVLRTTDSVGNWALYAKTVRVSIAR
jgi:hypothetical protein